MSRVTDEERRNMEAIKKLVKDEERVAKEMEGAPSWAEAMKEDLPSDLHGQIDHLVEMRGQYEASPDIGRTGGAVTGGYTHPDPKHPKSLEELREGREYKQSVVDEFISKITDPEFIPPGVSLVLFIAFLTQIQPNFVSKVLGTTMAKKSMDLYYFFREAEEWTKVNILIELKEWFIRSDPADQDKSGPFERYIQPFKAAARAEDKRKAEEANGHH